MNDRFKFRVWDKIANKYWFSGCVNINTDGNVFIIPVDSNEKFMHLGNDTVIIEQCTGLKDNCGNLIYEGDIVEDMWGDALFIKWRDSEARFAAEDDNVAYDLEDVVDGCEIIGNIHEQTEQKDK